MRLHAYAAAADPEIQATTRAAFRELRDSVEQLTGLPPAQVHRWFGIGILMTAATAMNLQAVHSPRHAIPGEQRRTGK
jgi:hypothetical protein